MFDEVMSENEGLQSGVEPGRRALPLETSAATPVQ